MRNRSAAGRRNRLERLCLAGPAIEIPSDPGKRYFGGIVGSMAFTLVLDRGFCATKHVCPILYPGYGRVFDPLYMDLQRRKRQSAGDVPIPCRQQYNGILYDVVLQTHHPGTALLPGGIGIVRPVGHHRYWIKITFAKSDSDSCPKQSPPMNSNRKGRRRIGRKRALRFIRLCRIIVL